MNNLKLNSIQVSNALTVLENAGIEATDFGSDANASVLLSTLVIEVLKGLDHYQIELLWDRI